MPVAKVTSRIATKELDKTLIRDEVAREHCAIDAATCAELRVQIGDQVRVRRIDDPHLYALYTVKATPPRLKSGEIYMWPAGWPRVTERDLVGCFGAFVRWSGRRVGTSELPEIVEVDTNVVAPPHLPEAEAEATSEFIERVMGRGNDVAVLAPHGGMIEEGTDLQAEAAVERLLRAGKATIGWLCKGWRSGNGAKLRWHITSTDLSTRSFPLLAEISRAKFRHAIAFHGWEELHIGVGGRAPREIKEQVKAAIEIVTRTEVRLDDSEKYGGTSAANIVNRLAYSGEGLQIEQPLIVRAATARATAIAEAVADVVSKL